MMMVVGTLMVMVVIVMVMVMEVVGMFYLWT